MQWQNGTFGRSERKGWVYFSSAVFTEILYWRASADDMRVSVRIIHPTDGRPDLRWWVWPLPVLPMPRGWKGGFLTTVGSIPAVICDNLGEWETECHRGDQGNQNAGQELHHWVNNCSLPAFGQLISNDVHSTDYKNHKQNNNETSHTISTCQWCEQ